MIVALLKWMVIGLLTFVVQEIVMNFIFKGRFDYVTKYLKWTWETMDTKENLIWILGSILVILLASVIWPIALVLTIIKDYKNRNLMQETFKNGF